MDERSFLIDENERDDNAVYIRRGVFHDILLELYRNKSKQVIQLYVYISQELPHNSVIELPIPKICEDLQLSKNLAKRALEALTSVDFLRKIASDTYFVNPYVLTRGRPGNPELEVQWDAMK